MKIFIDELPKDCKECPCRQDVVLEKEKLKWVECNIQDLNKFHVENIEGHEVQVLDCPLELIADHDKQKDQRIAELEKEAEAYQKEINDFCNKRYFGSLKDADKKLTELEEKCKWQDKEIELDGEKLKALEEENAKLQEQVGYYIFADGYDESDKPIHQQLFKTYKSAFEELKQDRIKYIDKIDYLEEQLKNAIVPKFKMGQEVWYYHIGRYKTYSGVINDIKWFARNGWIYYRLPNLQRDDFWIREDELFATEAEAQKYLEEHK